MLDFDPKQVFGRRVDNYVRYRPGYPDDLLAPLIRDCGLSPDWQVADIGAGTGLLARLFLDYGCAVSGVEPNTEMRQAGERMLSGYPRYSSLQGTAEATGIANASIDLVVAGQAFHWFDAPRARDEFGRILKPGGWVALAWNRMIPGADAFMRDLTGLILAHSPGWSETTRRDQPGSRIDLPAFFGGGFTRAGFPNQQVLDWDGLRGRVLSIGHVPQPDDPTHAAMFARLQALFEHNQHNGQVVIRLETELYYGRLD